MVVRVLAVCLCTAFVAAQRDLRQWPTDSLKAPAKLPVSEDVSGGYLVTVVDDKGERVVDADVYVVGRDGVDAETR